ncbi:MAG: hypothetical protein R3E89_05655 [Thiolinea sp.]
MVFAPAAGVGSRLWVDLDADGYRDDEEPGLADARVSLTAPDRQAASSLFGRNRPRPADCGER